MAGRRKGTWDVRTYKTERNARKRLAQVQAHLAALCDAIDGGADGLRWPQRLEDAGFVVCGVTQ